MARTSHVPKSARSRDSIKRQRNRANRRAVRADLSQYQYGETED